MLFALFQQFFQVTEAASKAGLSPISNPILYVQDAQKTRKLTYSLQPQNIVQYAAVFYKSSRKSNEKHYFSTGKDYEGSSTPAWTNVTSNISPSKNRLLDQNEIPYNPSERSKEMYKFILRQWCRPGGICYHPFAKTMAAGLAAYDIGIKYIAVEEDSKCFDAARRRILEAVSRPIKRKLSEEDVLESPDKREGGRLATRKKPEKSLFGKYGDSATSSEDSEDVICVPLEKKGASSEPGKYIYYPERQDVSAEEADGSESDNGGNADPCSMPIECAARDQCKFLSMQTPPSHNCVICRAPVHNLCDYGKRVVKDYTREQIYSCSFKCYNLEGKK